MTDIRIKSIQCPVNSSDGDCLPRRQNTWQVDFPITSPASIGIGYMVEPEPFSKSWSHSEFAMHDHKYSSAGVPDAARAELIYEFSNAVVVRDLLVVQHTNGITQIEGFVGASKAGPWASIGIATSRRAGNASGSGVFVEGARDVFELPAWGRAATHLRLVVRKTSLLDGWATYRIYPRNSKRDPITVDSVDIVAAINGMLVVYPEPGKDEKSIDD